MSECTEKEFNEYCAEVMGHKRLSAHYTPYDDLNQMAEVVEKLVSNIREQKYAPELYQDVNPAYKIFLHGIQVKRAFRDFIISTMPEKP